MTLLDWLLTVNDENLVIVSGTDEGTISVVYYYTMNTFFGDGHTRKASHIHHWCNRVAESCL